MTSLYHPRPERWPQVSLRTCLLVVTLIGGAFGWISAQIQWIHDRHAAMDYREEQEGQIILDAVMFSDGGSVAAPWSIRVFGEQGIGYIAVRKVSHRGRELARLFPEAEIVGDQP
jgi:hypothetical protein